MFNFDSKDFKNIYIFLYITFKKFKITFSPKTVIIGLDFNIDFFLTDKTLNLV